jgi:hypothetical protein
MPGCLASASMRSLAPVSICAPSTALAILLASIRT